MEIKTELIDELLKDYKKPEDIIGEHGLLKQFVKAVLERAMHAELTEHLGYPKHAPAGHNSGNSRNGTSSKTVKGDFGEVTIEVPRDRAGTFEPRILPKHQTRFTGFDDKIVSMYARGMTTREIEGHLKEIYGVEVSAGLISQVTEAVGEEVKAWQNRALEPLYAIVYLDALYVKMRHEGRVENRAVYVAMGVDLEGKKDVLGLWTSANEGAKFWLSVLTELKNRGVKDLFIVCVDGLKGFPQAVEASFPQAQVQSGAVMYRAPDAGQSGVCELEGAQGGGGRFEAHLPGRDSGRSRDGVGQLHAAVGRQVQSDWQAVEGELGAHHPVFCLPAGSAQGDLHDQCGGVAAHEPAQDHQEPGIVSQRGSGAEAAVSGAAECERQMGGGAALEGGAEPVRDSLGRSDQSRAVIGE